MMEAIILAGGLGTRLREVVPDLPKPMASVAGRPFLEILLSSLAQKGFHRVILSLGHMAEKISKHFGNNFYGMELVYEIESIPLGTGGALRASLLHSKNDHIFVFNGDTYLDIESQEMEKKWKKNHKPLIVSCHVPDTSRYGRLDVSAGRVNRLIEKGKSGPGLINGGCYLIPTNILNGFIVGHQFSFEADFLAKALQHQYFEIFVSNGLFIDIGIPEDYARAQTELADLLKG
ncbi:MAG: nucleotidyltransferase family protein [Pseudobdellovibrionaceae bacterium]